jgi:S-adenosylmethionine decarboxylase proenzyme
VLVCDTIQSGRKPWCIKEVFHFILVERLPKGDATIATCCHFLSLEGLLESMVRNSNETNTAVAVETEDDGRYAVDIRVFLATITIAMALSFVVGVALGEVPPLTRNASPAKVVRDYLNVNEATKKMVNQHLPAGQHLLVDIEGVNGDFLNSEERLSLAMVETVNEAGLTMLSYHCHSLVPSGVSCVGVLLESHISFHTWPSEGVITLDLFTCGSNPLLPVVKVIERLFGIGDKVRSQWSHELRGFRPEEEKRRHYLDDNSDLALWVLSPLDVYSKEQIYSNMTKFQRVDIWDLREVCMNGDVVEESRVGQSLRPLHFAALFVAFSDYGHAYARRCEEAQHDAR